MRSHFANEVRLFGFRAAIESQWPFMPTSLSKNFSSSDSKLLASMRSIVSTIIGNYVLPLVYAMSRFTIAHRYISFPKVTISIALNSVIFIS